MFRLAALVVCVALATGLGAAPQPQATPQAPLQTAPQSPPRFQAGVDAIPLDITVIDSNRRPVRGLTPADFTILENGELQPIVSFDEISVPAPDPAGASWMREVGTDVVSNNLDTRRLIVLVLDDGFMGVDHGEPQSTRTIAHSVIDHLGPADLAAVVHTWQGRSQNFTGDRARLRAAVDAFTPRASGSAGPPLGCQLRRGGCAVDAMTRVGEFLRTAPAGRKNVVMIGPGIPFSNRMAENPDSFSPLEGLGLMFQNLQLANASVYTFDPRGLMTSGLVDRVALAEATGGRSIENTNDPELQVGRMFEENSSYYLIGYQSTHSTPDGRYRKIEVRVNRPGAEVRTRKGYYGPRRTAPRPQRGPAPAPIEVALAGGLPAVDLDLRVTAAAFAVAGRRTAELAAVLLLREAAPESSSAASARPEQRRVEIVAAAFDTDGRNHGSQKQTIELTLNPTAGRSAEYEVVSRLPLRPGRYELRVAAESAGQAGSVFMSVDVPDFARDRLSVSGVLIERLPPLRSASRTALTDLVPVLPTAIRSFGPREQGTAFLRVYQGGSRPLEPVRVTSRVVDGLDREVVSLIRELAAADFGATRAADHRVTLPTASLPPGAYLLDIIATMGERRVQRQLRFSVGPG